MGIFRCEILVSYCHAIYRKAEKYCWNVYFTRKKRFAREKVSVFQSHWTYKRIDISKTVKNKVTIGNFINLTIQFLHKIMNQINNFNSSCNKTAIRFRIVCILYYFLQIDTFVIKSNSLGKSIKFWFRCRWDVFTLNYCTQN